MGTLRAVKLVHREDFSRDRPFTREYEGLLHYEPISRSHPNLMQILHVGRHDGYFYYVTELADDASVRDAPGRSRFDPRAQKTPDNAAEHIPAPAPRMRIAVTTAPMNCSRTWPCSSGALRSSACAVSSEIAP